MKLGLYVFLSLSLWVATSTRAAGPDLTLDSAVVLALTHNADLAVARMRVAEAASRVGNAGRWSNPELQTEFKPNVRGREGSLIVGFNQRFPLTSRLRLEKAVSRSEVAVAEAEVREAERQLALAVRTVGIRLLALRAHAELMERQLRNSRELSANVARAARVGEGSELETAQLELETAQLEPRQVQLKAETEPLEGQLRLLLGLPPTAQMNLAELPDAPASSSSNSATTETRADDAVARAKLDSANQSIELARASRWEDATIGFFGEVERGVDAPNGVKTDGFVGLRFSVPLPIWNDRRGQVGEAAARAARIESEADALAVRIRAEVAAAVGQQEAAAKQQRSIDDKLLPMARDLERRLIRLHSEGQAPFTDVLRAFERRLQLEASAIDARRDSRLAHVRWMAATGQTHLSKP
jgi:cobalt-zinc-cadmium efflux system outer membrane protein